jgi:flagellar biosynthesis GTPase FlhF
MSETKSMHLAISLVEAGVPNKNTIAKIHAELNEDLVGNNKYSQGKKEFLGVNVFRRLLNDAFDSKWSWEILDTRLMPNYEDPEYAFVIGRLYLPGLGFRDGVGTAKMDKKDNSASFAVATSNAFKNALKQSGFGASVLDEDFFEDLYDEEFEEEEDEPEAKPEPKKEKKEAPKKEAPKKEEKPAAKKEKKEAPKEEPKKKKAGAEFSDEQKEAMAELKEIYNIDTNKELLGFMQLWKPELKSVGEVTPEELDKFLAYYDENEEEFEDFDPEEVA